MVAGYEHPFVGRWGAVTAAALGDGRITTVGTAPDAELAHAVATDSVTLNSATSGAGRRLRFLHNGSCKSVVVAV